MRNLEVEFKYSADELSFVEFEEFIKKLSPLTTIRASGYDHFYDSAKSPDSFARHRVGPAFNQLTFKRKIADKNNYVRVEHNISLDMNVKAEQVSSLMKEFGYAYNSTIFKNVFVYAFDRYNFVYYICYTPDLKELGRFVEIEMSEDHAWEDEKEAWVELLGLEGDLKPLGITSRHRLKLSLFEMFKK